MSVKMKTSAASNLILMRLLWGILILLPTRALAWGQEGHEAIAALAQTMLSNSVLAKVQSILRTNEMASVALWAHQARQFMRNHTSPFANNEEPKTFAKDRAAHT